MKKNHSIKKLNRIMVGGRVSYFALVSSISDLKKVIHLSNEQRMPFYILGNGSNVLIDDEDFKGIVIKLSGRFKSVAFDSKNNTVTTGAAFSLMELGNEIARRGYMGCAYMSVIPGTVGGAVRMNAGTHKEGEIKDHFLTACLFDPATCELSEYSKQTMMFAYRESILSKTNKIVVEVTFQPPEQREAYSQEAQKIASDLLASRLAKQPKNQRNFGSTFKHPNGPHSAGWYLERVGMKGFRAGDAMVAEEHANWIVNINNATSKDAKNLIDIGQKRVFEEYGVRLEREVVYLPQDIQEWT